MPDFGGEEDHTLVCTISHTLVHLYIWSDIQLENMPDETLAVTLY